MAGNGQFQVTVGFGLGSELNITWAKQSMDVAFCMLSMEKQSSVRAITAHSQGGAGESG